MSSVRAKVEVDCVTPAEREFLVVDAFTATVFSGNPAAVLTDASALSEGQMQSIAAEFNLSETTFILPGCSGASSEPADVRFRWFTPQTEVDLCGHATIAGVHALLETGRLFEPVDETTSLPLRIATRSGVLTAYVERIPSGAGRMIWLDLIPAELTAVSFDLQELAVVLGVEIERFDAELRPERTPQGKAVVFVHDTFALNDARPDFGHLDRWLRRTGLWGLSLATVRTLSPSIHVQSRFFAPPVGVNEDPVTGSVHGPLAAYLVKHGRVPVVDGLAGLTCVQGVPGGRAGLVHGLVQPREDGRFDVRIGGQAVTVMRGRLMISNGPPHG